MTRVRFRIEDIVVDRLIRLQPFRWIDEMRGYFFHLGEVTIHLREQCLDVVKRLFGL